VLEQAASDSLSRQRQVPAGRGADAPQPPPGSLWLIEAMLTISSIPWN